MNKSIVKLFSKIHLSALLLVVLMTVSAGSVQAEVDSHEVAYAQALNKVVESHGRLVNEMERVRVGQVHHFDYLQNEHLELLRFAGALRFPPASLPAARRAEMTRHAENMLAQVSDLEWVIADFLRSHAQLGSGLSNAIDLAKLQAARASDTQMKSTLNRLGKAAEQFRQQPDSSSLEALSQAFSDIDYNSLSEQSSGELKFQQRLILGNATKPEAYQESVRDTNLEDSVRQLEMLLQG